MKSDDKEYLALPIEERKKVDARSGFPIYEEKNLTKVNDMRRAKSRPEIDLHIVPALTKGQVMFVTASQMGNEPASCYSCHLYNLGRSCMLMGPNVLIKKFTMGTVEYWPCCGMQDYGKPNTGKETFSAHDDPDSLGLVWINAPSVGQPCGGANCGGSGGGDDCDHYFPYDVDDKRDSTSGFCRILQVDVGVGDVCSGWQDDDAVYYDEAEAWMRKRIPPPPRERK